MKRLFLLLLCLVFCTASAEDGFSAYVPEDRGAAFADIVLPAPDASGPYVHFDRDVSGRITRAEALLGPETLCQPGTEAEAAPELSQGEADLLTASPFWTACRLISSRLYSLDGAAEGFVCASYLQYSGMLPVEMRIESHIRASGGHVLYRVTPEYRGDERLCRGLLLEAASLEDDTLRICVYCPNVQPGFLIDHATGTAAIDAAFAASGQKVTVAGTTEQAYVLNTSSHRFHYPDCSSVPKIKEKNRADYVGDRETLIEQGYQPCGACHP